MKRYKNPHTALNIGEQRIYNTIYIGDLPGEVTGNPFFPVNSLSDNRHLDENSNIVLRAYGDVIMSVGDKPKDLGPCDLYLPTLKGAGIKDVIAFYEDN